MYHLFRSSPLKGCPIVSVGTKRGRFSQARKPLPKTPPPPPPPPKQTPTPSKFRTFTGVLIGFGGLMCGIEYGFTISMFTYWSYIHGPDPAKEWLKRRFDPTSQFPVAARDEEFLLEVRMAIEEFNERMDKVEEKVQKEEERRKKRKRKSSPLVKKGDLFKVL
ncbi:hypothetical protein CCACVL1_06473 [Corchorus capsularis]|uniref:Uncharacterized protein n=1 Tax=Corchorus capsularis TaxID=210143 RepID=A0A1R3JFF7_COCAP|nr:hypothetical protein CCACVL1_06473 [Corchorus capsularis]